jgi:hypothetical protein
MAWESLSVLNGGVIASQTDPNLWGRRIAKTQPAWAEGTAGAAPPSRAVLTISYRLKLRVAVCDCKPFARATIQNFEETWRRIRRQNRPMKSEAAS